jgi:hypothetical protein
MYMRREMNHRVFGGALVLVATVTSACAHVRPTPEPTTPAAPDARAVAVYRTVAESVYVRTTGRPIAIATMSADTTCTTNPCGSLAERWGLEPLASNGADSGAILQARNDLLARSRRPLDLSAVPVSEARLVGTTAAAIPPNGADVQQWILFRDAHGGAAGGVTFSPVGFDSARRTALVYVDWRCGPACGHRLRATLRATTDSTWTVADMLLLSSERAFTATP